jgi:hypothetical protein
MAAPYYVARIAGFFQRIAAAVVATPNSIVATNASGTIDPSFLPPGIIADTISVVASEALAAGALVNVWDNAGVANARNADNSVSTKQAVGFVIAAVISGGTALVYGMGQNNTAVTGLTPGTYYWLGTVGGVTATPPSAVGSLDQIVGVANTSGLLKTFDSIAGSCIL